MRSIKEILRLKFEKKLSNRMIAKSLSISHNTVGELVRRFNSSNLIWPLPENIDESTLEKKLYPLKTRKKNARMDMDYIQKELRQKGVTLQLLWQEYKETNPEGLQYSQFCERYRQWKKTIDVSMHQTYKAGEKMFIDWAGKTGKIVNKKTGEIKKAYLFVAALGASSYTYCEAFLSMDLKSWISAHCHAFEYFDGVSEIIIPDNTKTGVTKPCYYEPDINPTYQDMAKYYNIAVIPARVNKARDKAKVESAVRTAEMWILAKLRNHKFFNIFDFNEAIFEYLEELNKTPFQKMEGSRHSIYETTEKAALKPLPKERYVFAVWKDCTVNIDHHIAFEKNYYSTPYQLVRKKVSVRASSTTVEIFYKGNRVASHLRKFGKAKYSTEKQHRPKSHQEYLNWTPSRLISWAKSIGPNTSELVKKVLEKKLYPEQAYRKCLGIIRLGKSYPYDRMEKAAQRAIKYDTISYRSFVSILKKGLDQIPSPEENETEKPINHENIRGSHYYSQRGGE